MDRTSNFPHDALGPARSDQSELGAAHAAPAPYLPSLDVATWARRPLTALLPDALAHFLLSLRAERTRLVYLAAIEEFVAFCEGIEAPVRALGDIGEKSVLLWQENLARRHVRHTGAKRGVVQSTVANKLSALSSFLDFAKKRGLVDVNPMALVHRPRVRRESRTHAFTSDETKALLDALKRRCASTADAGGTPYATARLRLCVIATLLSVGMRVDELCSLRIADFDDDVAAPRLRFRAKGGVSHAPYLNSATATLLRGYIREFRAHAAPSDWLFIRVQKVRARAASRLHRSSVSDMIKAAAKEVGIEKRVSPHSCRATLATLLHDAGVPLGQVQDLLNHKQITTTSLYVKKSREVADAAALKLDFGALARKSRKSDS